jgi:hypothetical protein
MVFKDIDIYQLKDELETRKLICFGGGKVFHEFFCHDIATAILDKLYGVLDNNIQENKVEINGREVPIISIQDLFGMEDIIIMISCAAISEIYEQLSKYEELKHTPFCAVYYIRSRTSQTDEKKYLNANLIKVGPKQLIPKKIHYCWFGKGNMPEDYVEWMKSWKRFCPDYEIIRWDETNYDIAKNEYMHEAYKAKKWSFVSDYARIDVINQYGGIYLDTDVELIRNLDMLLYQAAFAGIDSFGYVNLGLGFGAYTNNKILRELLRFYDELHFKKEDGTYDTTGCPILQNEVYVKHGFKNGQCSNIDGMNIYPPSVFAPQDFYTGEINITEYTYSIHHYAASWFSESSKTNILKTNNLYRLIKENGR